jgi:hypothetical protein
MAAAEDGRRCKARNIIRNEAYFFVRRPSGPESSRCGEKDSGQAGMTLRLHFSMLIRYQ